MKWTTVLMLVLAACTRPTGNGLTDEQFIETMVELRQAALQAGSDTAQFIELRQRVLDENGVTDAQLRAYVDSASSDLDHLATVWDSISARILVDVQ